MKVISAAIKVNGLTLHWADMQLKQFTTTKVKVLNITVWLNVSEE